MTSLPAPQPAVSWPEPSIGEVALDDERYWADRYGHDPDPDDCDDVEAA